MNMPMIEVPKWALTAMNNLAEMERKIAISGDPSNLTRNIERIKEALQGENIFFEDPMGQLFSETRTDLEATIAGLGTDNLVVVEVLKPIVRVGNREYSRVVQKGIVFVESRPSQIITAGDK
jgi:hypothetical protein